MENRGPRIGSFSFLLKEAKPRKAWHRDHSPRVHQLNRGFMSFTITGDQTTISIAWDEITLIIIVLSICSAWIITTKIKYPIKSQQ